MRNTVNDDPIVWRKPGPDHTQTAPDIAYAYVKDYQRLRPDVTAVGPDLAAVAGVRGLDPGRLAATVEEYNRQLAAGAPDPFGRAAGHRKRVDPALDWGARLKPSVG